MAARRTTEPATPTAIAATTINGKGLVLPIAKAISHFMTVYNAISRGWPLSPDDAVAELVDATDHLRSAVIPREALTVESAEAIDAWIADITTRTEAIRATIRGDALSTEQTDSIRQAATNSWQLLTTLDRELTGLEIRDTDPGEMP